jgi:transposase
MRIALTCVTLALMAGCSTVVPPAVVPPAALTFDPTRPPPRVVLPAQEVVALTERAAQLQIERHAIRARIAAETDIWARQRLYADLHRVGMELSPLERRLAGVSGSR